MSKQITKAEVAQHKDEKSMYIIIDDGVYDVAGRLLLWSLPSTRGKGSGTPFHALVFSMGISHVREEQRFPSSFPSHHHPAATPRELHVSPRHPGNEH